MLAIIFRDSVLHREDRKVSDFIFFCENLEDFNEARLHEATL